MCFTLRLCVCCVCVYVCVGGDRSSSRTVAVPADIRLAQSDRSGTWLTRVFACVSLTTVVGLQRASPDKCLSLVNDKAGRSLDLVARDKLTRDKVGLVYRPKVNGEWSNQVLPLQWFEALTTIHNVLINTNKVHFRCLCALCSDGCFTVANCFFCFLPHSLSAKFLRHSHPDPTR